MKIKKIRAGSFREALSLVKRELGKDAVILSSEDRRGMRSCVEVTAAVDYDIETIDDEYKDIAKYQDDTSHGSDPDSSGDISMRLFSSGFMELKNEIKCLRDCIENMKNSGFELKLPIERGKMFHFLKKQSVKEEFALRLVEGAHDLEELKMRMSENMRTSSMFVNNITGKGSEYSRQSRRIIMLIGPTGVGKTTTVAKLASKAIKEGKKVAMMSIDTYKIGAAEQIRIYSRMMGIPLDIVSSVENLKWSVNRFSDRDILLIDTTGQNPGEKEYIKGLEKVYRIGLPIETQLLLSTSSDCDFLMHTYQHYKSLPIDYIAFTKTDEAVKFGSIYNLCCLYKKPVAYITTGQKVPGNIEFVDSKKLANLIIRTGSA